MPRRSRDPIPFPPSREDPAPCALCGRQVPQRLLTLHHLLPKEKGGKAEHRIPTCKPCHKTVHATYNNATLAKRFTTVDAIKQAPELQSYFAWIVKQSPDRNFQVDLHASHPHQSRRGRRWR